MKPQIKYIELKTGFNDNGSAWIGLVSFSKSGRTIYFNGKAFQSLAGTGIYANYFDIETGEEYWISGVKKDMTDRHWAGGGKIFVEKRIVEDYLKILNREILSSTLHEIIDNIIIDIPKQRINQLENEIIIEKQFNDDLFFRNPTELTDAEIKFVIDNLIVDEENSRYNKGRRATRKSRILFEEEAEKRGLNKN
ncbi:MULTISPECIES: hypothetical protein [Flavobacterium]|uniref:hypothetical protein n=1 Tax=Flavobacterium TaxID=237 RepID=UPI0019686421|nr:MULTISPECIES: hypothetical protein [Flavobacterium]